MAVADRGDDMRCRALAFLVTAACGDAPGPAGETDGAETTLTGPQGSVGTTQADVSSSSSPATSGESSGLPTSAETGADTDTEPPPPPEVPDACLDPVVTPGPTLTAAPDGRFDAVAIAWTGTVTGLLYAEATGELTWELALQRLDATGATLSAPTMLGDITLAQDEPIGEPPRPVASLTASGDQFVACHGDADGGGSISCSTISEDGSVASGIAVGGQSPGIAAGPAGLGLVYIDGSDFLSQLLAADATPVGNPHVVLTTTRSPFPAIPSLVATNAGYVAYADILFPRFDAMFEEIEGGAALGWTSLPVSLAGTQDVAAAATGSLDGVEVRVITPDDEDFSAPQRIDGLEGNTSAATVAITRADASFAVIWSVDPTLEYAAVGLDGGPLGEPQSVLDLSSRSDSLDTTAVEDGFIVAAATGFSADEIVIAHLACP